MHSVVRNKLASAIFVSALIAPGLAPAASSGIMEDCREGLASLFKNLSQTLSDTAWAVQVAGERDAYNADLDPDEQLSILEFGHFKRTGVKPSRTAPEFVLQTKLNRLDESLRTLDRQAEETRFVVSGFGGAVDKLQEPFRRLVVVHEQMIDVVQYSESRGLQRPSMRARAEQAETIMQWHMGQTWRISGFNVDIAPFREAFSAATIHYREIQALESLP